MERKFALYKAMVEFFAGDPKRCQHFIKVSSLCRYIASSEGADAALVELVEAAGLVHDCGIKISELKYGKGHCSGKQQEEEGPAPARKMLAAAGYAQETVERICYLVGHHHTYNKIDGLDYQILVEADFLVNFYEDAMDAESIAAIVKNIFRTESGITLAKSMFGLEEKQQSMI